MYAPQLSLAPAGNVRLGATVIFPLDFNGIIDPPLVEQMPGQPPVNLIAGGNTPVQVGAQQAYGHWPTAPVRPRRSRRRGAPGPGPAAGRA